MTREHEAGRPAGGSGETDRDAAACRERLGRLVADEAGGLGQLVALLNREHDALQAGDMPALEAAMRERQQCVGVIVHADHERRALCRTLGYPGDAQGLERLLRWCDPQGTLAADWARCSSTAAQCRMLNDRNGALAGTRLQHVRARLGMLLSTAREAPTYGRGGASPAGGVGQVVKTEV